MQRPACETLPLTVSALYLVLSAYDETYATTNWGFDKYIPNSSNCVNHTRFPGLNYVWFV